MIFVTVGSVFPFDRLVSAADDWADRRGVKPLAQIGRSNYVAKALNTVGSLENARYRDAVAESRAVVAHAGMGSILTASKFGKPIVIMPRRKALNEHTTDHQLDTADWMSALPGVHVARDESELGEKIDYAMSSAVPAQIRAQAAPELIESLKRRLNAYLA